MVASIAQWLTNIPNPIMLTIINQEEGSGKTSLSKFLIPRMLKTYSCLMTKNLINHMEDIYTRNYFVIHDEMIGINKWTLERWKNIQTSDELTTKRKYEEYEITRKKLSVSIATTNSNQERGGFIQSGDRGRRFASIELDTINWPEYIRNVDVDQMWAEALLLYESSNYNYVLNTEDFTEIIKYNSRYIKNNSSYIYALTLLSKPENDQDGVWMNPTEIIQDISNKRILNKRIYLLNPMDLGSSLTSIGFRCEKQRRCTAREFESVKYSYPLRRYFVKRNY